MTQRTPRTETTHVLLCRMREQQVAANRAEVARARTMVELFQQLSADYQARHAAEPHFTAADDRDYHRDRDRHRLHALPDPRRHRGGAAAR